MVRHLLANNRMQRADKRKVVGEMWIEVHVSRAEGDQRE